MSGNLDDAHIESCSRTVEQEAAIGIDGRMRRAAGNRVFQAAMRAFSRKYRFAPAGSSNAPPWSRNLCIDATIAEFARRHRRHGVRLAGCGRHLAARRCHRRRNRGAFAVDRVHRAAGDARPADDADGGRRHAPHAAGDLLARGGGRAHRLGDRPHLHDRVADEPPRAQRHNRGLARRRCRRRLCGRRSEVKALANQTSRATEDISKQFAARSSTRPSTRSRRYHRSRAPSRRSPKLPARSRPRLRSRAPPTREIAGSMRTTAGSTARAKRSGPKMARFWLACLAKLPVMPSPSRAPRSSSCGSPASRTD